MEAQRFGGTDGHSSSGLCAFFDVSYEESMRRMGNRGDMSANDISLKRNKGKMECVKNEY